MKKFNLKLRKKEKENLKYLSLGSFGGWIKNLSLGKHAVFFETIDKLIEEI